MSQIFYFVLKTDEILPATNPKTYKLQTLEQSFANPENFDNLNDLQNIIKQNIEKNQKVCQIQISSGFVISDDTKIIPLQVFPLIFKIKNQLFLNNPGKQNNYVINMSNQYIQNLQDIQIPIESFSILNSYFKQNGEYISFYIQITF